MIEDKKMFSKVSDGNYIENFGLYYEDITPGITVKHWPGRTITETDNVLMSMMAMNHHPIHMDEKFSQSNQWGKTIVSSLVTVSIVGGLSLRGTSANGTANLGWKNINLVRPVFVGNTLYAETTYLSKRLSKSRPGEGVVEVKTRALNQNNEEVLNWERTFLVKCSES